MSEDEKSVWRIYYFRALKIISEYEYEGKKVVIGYPTLDRRFYTPDVVKEDGYGRLREIVRDIEKLEETQYTDKDGLLLPKMTDAEIELLVNKIIVRRFPEQ